MKTLHHCHWQNMEHLMSMKKVLGLGDVVVFYGKIDAQTWQQINRQLPSHQHFIVNSADCPHIKPSIDHRRWADLIINYQRIFAWK